jgi:hypothetical protein
MHTLKPAPRSVLAFCSQCLALLIGVLLSQTLSAATFTVTPAAVSNSYNGTITLTITNFNNGDSILVQKYIDVNTNGVIDDSDCLVQQYKLIDGQPGMVISGVTNLNVPGDSTGTNGAIVSQQSFVNSGIAQQMVGQYFYRISSLTGSFTAVTNSFTVTNTPYAQTLSGTVQSGGTNVPYASVLLFVPSPGGDMGAPVAGTIANSSGVYSVSVPPGTYLPWAFKSGYVVDMAALPRVSLNPGDTLATNLFLLPAGLTISGQAVDAANTNRGLPGIMAAWQSDDNLMAVGFTDTNGNFNAGVTSGAWQWGGDNAGLVLHGYLDFGEHGKLTVLTTNGSVANVLVPFTKGTALFYGSVKDGQNLPLAGVSLSASTNNGGGFYEGDATSDQNGKYSLAIVGGTWDLQANNDNTPGLANYIFSRAQGLAITAGSAVQQKIVGIVATNSISGYLKDNNGNPLSGIGVSASATINGAMFNLGNTDTDDSGFYSLQVGNGLWTVGVSCGGGNNSLGSQYQCPDFQTVEITNNNATANFTATLPSSQIAGYVKDTGNHPVTNVAVYAFGPNGNNPMVLTDSSGRYFFNVANGSWTIGVMCCGNNNALNSLGLLCVSQQTNNVFNSTNEVDFVVSPAPYQITGHLRDGYGNGISNVNVYAGSGPWGVCATTDSGGYYSFFVTNGDWFISLDCGFLGSLGDLCPNGQWLTISGAGAVVDFTTLQVPYTLSGSVRNNSSQAITNLHVQASAMIGTNSYVLDSWTDTNGNFLFQVANGQWLVHLACNMLGGGYVCPNDATVTIAGASAVTNFIVQPCGPLQIVTATLPPGQLGSYYSYTLQASGCNPGYGWVLYSGSFPPGIAINPSTGEIFGIPTNSGTFTFTVQVIDSRTNTATQGFSLLVAPSSADVKDYYITKLESFMQLNPTNVVPDTNHGPYHAVLGIVQAAPNSVPIANVDLPSGVVKGFPPGNSGIELQSLESFSTQADLDAAYTNGNYTFALATMHNGFQFPMLTLPPALYPAAPRVTNYAAAQSINPFAPFMLQWSNPPDATTNDVIWVLIVDSKGAPVFSTPYPATNYPNALNGTMASVLVPTNTFKFGEAYTGVITFFRTTSFNPFSYPGAAGMTFVSVQTSFPLTVPVASAPGVSLSSKSGAQFSFLLTGVAGQNYTVLATTNLSLPLSNWFPVLITNLSGSSALIRDSQATNQQRFYRVKVGL